jgi:Methyltransferase domain
MKPVVFSTFEAKLMDSEPRSSQRDYIAEQLPQKRGFVKRVLSFLSHPRKSLVFRSRPFLTPYLQKYHERKLAAKMDLDFLSRRPSHAYTPDFSDFWFLYKTVRRRKPRVVIEFGSGGSTVVIARALLDNMTESPEHSGYLYSIDDQEYWAEATRSTIPPELKEICEVTYVPTVEQDWDGHATFRHAHLPAITPDLIYLDGPTLRKDRKIAVDVLDLESKFRPGFVLIIDGRTANTEFLKDYLTRLYTYKDRTLYNNTVLELFS